MDYKRKDDNTVQVIAERIDNLHTHISDLRISMKESMQDIAAAINKLVKIEEGQAHMMQTIVRMNGVQDKQEAKCNHLERRLDELEKDAPLNRQARRWVFTAVWGVVSLAGVAVAKFFGLM